MAIHRFARKRESERERVALEPQHWFKGTTTGNLSPSWVLKPWFLADIPLSQPIEKPGADLSSELLGGNSQARCA